MPLSESDNLDELSDYFEFYAAKSFRFDGRKLSAASQMSDYRVSGFTVG